MTICLNNNDERRKFFATLYDGHRGSYYTVFDEVSSMLNFPLIEVKSDSITTEEQLKEYLENKKIKYKWVSIF